MPIAIKIKNTINISNNNASILKPNTIQDKIFAIFAFCGISKPFKLAMRLALLAMTNDTIAKIKLPNPKRVQGSLLLGVIFLFAVFCLLYFE